MKKIIVAVSFFLFSFGASLCLIRSAYSFSDPFPSTVNPPAVEDFLPSPNNMYYCAPWGDNGAGNGSNGNPWLDLQGGQGVVQPGDVIYFRGGLYPEYPEHGRRWAESLNKVEQGGTTDDPIVISNYPGEIAVWNSTSISWSMTLFDNQKLIGTKVGNDYGIKFIGGISVRGDNVQVSGVEFVQGTSNGGDMNPAMISNPVNADNVTNPVYSHNYFHDSKNTVDHGQKMSGIRFFIIYNATVEYNIFENMLELHDGGTVYHKDQIFGSKIRHNKFINCEAGVVFGGQGDYHRDLDVYNNLFYDVEHVMRYRSDLGGSYTVADPATWLNSDYKFHGNVALNIGNNGAFYHYLNLCEESGIVREYRDKGDFYNNVIDGYAIEEGWAFLSELTNNLPDLFDYNLWFDANDQNPRRDASSGRLRLVLLPEYFAHSVISSRDEFTYDPSSMTVTVKDTYPGRGVGRYGDTIGGFTFEGGGAPALPENLRLVD